MDSSEDKAQSDLPLKKLRTETRMCIICSTKAPVTQLPQPKNLESWEALLTAARLQQFEPILKYEAEPEISASISYHRECRSTFTHKNMLQKLTVQPGSSTSDVSSTEIRKSSRSTHDTSRQRARGGGGGHSGTEGGRTLVTYFAEEGVFF